MSVTEISQKVTEVMSELLYFKLRLKLFEQISMFSVLQKLKLLHKIQDQKNKSKCPPLQRVVSMTTSNILLWDRLAA